MSGRISDCLAALFSLTTGSSVALQVDAYLSLMCISTYRSVDWNSSCIDGNSYQAVVHVLLVYSAPASQPLTYIKFGPFLQHILLHSILPFIKAPEAALTSANAILHGSTIRAVWLKMPSEEKPQILPRVPPSSFR